MAAQLCSGRWLPSSDFLFDWIFFSANRFVRSVPGHFYNRSTKSIRNRFASDRTDRNPSISRLGADLSHGSTVPVSPLRDISLGDFVVRFVLL